LGKRKKLLVWAGIFAGTAVIILIALFAAAQYLLRSDAVRGRISAEISRVLSGKADFSGMEIDYFPRPGLIFRDFRLSQEETVCRIPALAVYPRIISLLQGSIDIDAVEIGEPDCSIKISPEEDEPPLSFLKKLDEKIARVSEALPAGMTLLVEKGKVRFSEQGGGTFTCTDLRLKSSFHNQELNIELQCMAAEWGMVSLAGRLRYDPGSLVVEKLSGRIAGSSLSGMNGKIALRGAPYVELQADGAEFILDELYPWIVYKGWLKESRARLKNLGGSITLENLRFEGPLNKPGEWRFSTAGKAQKVNIESTSLPPLLIREAEFEATREKAVLRGAKADFLDTSAEISGEVSIRNFEIQSATADMSGQTGRETLALAKKYVDIPERAVIPARAGVEQCRVSWDRSGAWSVQGGFAPQGGPRVYLDLARTPAELNVRRLAVKDDQSDATFSLKIAGDGAESSFRGVLHGKTLDRLYSSGQPEGAVISGDLTASISRREPLRSTARGWLRAGNVFFPLERAPSVTAHSVSLKAAGSQFSIESADMSWGEQRFTAGGAFQTSPEGVTVDLSISSGWIDLDRLLGYILGDAKEEGDAGGRKEWDLPFRGALRVSADRLDYRKLTAQPLSAVVSIGPQRIGIEFTQLFICGQTVPGRVVITPDGISMSFHSKSVNQEAEPFLACYFKKDAGLTGRFDLDLDVTGHLKYPDSLQGNFKLTLREGRVLRFELLNRILQFVNLTQIFVGRVPDLEEGGLAYDRINIDSRIEGSKLLLKEFILEGPTLGLAGQGTVDFIDEDIDLSILISPLRAADYIIGKIPVVRYLLRGSLIAVPVGAYGDWNDPIIVPLDPSVLSQSIMDVFRRVFKIPIKILEPLRSLESPPASTEGSPGP